jgi:nitrite reductase/ring-hydroxylating ferredoxin subunit
MIIPGHNHSGTMTRASNAPEKRLIALEHQENGRGKYGGERQVSRRGFNKLLTLGSLAAGASAVSIFASGCSETYPARVIAQTREIPVGGSKIFTYPTDIEPCLLLHPAENSYVAYSRICTHTSCPVFYRPEENRIVCPCHGGVYSVADGSVIAGPPPRPLPRITLEQRGSNLVATGVVKG